jgi:pimeloyl-ACP methyl ester carboxylesterase
MHNKPNLIFVHGSGQSQLSYNFLQIFLPEHNSLCLQYSTAENPDNILKRFKFLADQEFDGEPVSIVAHSYGCLLSTLFIKEYKNVDRFIALSSPWAGSRSAKWLAYVFRQSQLFKNTTPGSSLIKAISDTLLEFPITNIISTGTSSNDEVGMGAPNDGLLTVETQKAVPNGFSDCESIELSVSHNELLFSMDVVEIIQDKIFDGTANNTE